MSKFLPSTADDYFAALKYYRQQLKYAGTKEAARMAALAVESIRYAAIRRENTWLNKNHLREMHGCPVYFAGNQNCPDPPRGGIVDAHEGAVIVLDSTSGGLTYRPLDWTACGTRLRWPDDDTDLLGFCE